MTHSILNFYKDKNDEKLIIRCRIPKNVFSFIDKLNKYLSGFGKGCVDCFWLSKSKEIAYDFKTTLLYKSL